jgi:hypothetical protein
MEENDERRHQSVAFGMGNLTLDSLDSAHNPCDKLQTLRLKEISCKL